MVESFTINRKLQLKRMSIGLYRNNYCYLTFAAISIGVLTSIAISLCGGLTSMLQASENVMAIAKIIFSIIFTYPPWASYCLLLFIVHIPIMPRRLNRTVTYITKV